MKRLTASMLAVVLALLVSACDTTTPMDPAPLSGDGLSSSDAKAGIRQADGEFRFTQIEFPGATYTLAYGISPGGDIVGEYDDASGVTRGFLFSRGEYTMIEFPGAVMTQARGISPSGEIVGTYKLPGDTGPRFRSFTRSRSGEYSDLSYPGHTNIMAQRILPNGTILGCIHEDDMMASMKGMYMSRHEDKVFDIFASMHNGATPDLKRIVGLYTNREAGRSEGYIIDDGVFTPLLVPGSTTTSAWDVNASGDVVGIYRFAEGGRGHTRGFLLTDNGYTTIHFPGAMHTAAYGINAAGDVVGLYISGGNYYGFVASRTGRPKSR